MKTTFLEVNYIFSLRLTNSTTKVNYDYFMIKNFVFLKLTQHTKIFLFSDGYFFAFFTKRLQCSIIKMIIS